MLILAKEEAADIPDWVDAFWNSLSAIGGRSGEHQDIPELPDVTEGIEGFITAFTHFVHDDFRARESAWEFDLGRPQERQSFSPSWQGKLHLPLRWFLTLASGIRTLRR